MKSICSYCNKSFERRRKPKKFSYCSQSCQLHHEYKLGIRDKNKIIEKARTIAHVKQKIHNWLNDKSSRDNLRKVMQTEEYRLKASKRRIGKLNPMFGRFGEKAGNYKGGSSKNKYGVSSYGIGWKLIKSKIKLRDNCTCQDCGILEKDCKQNLQIHHIIPYKCTKDNSEDNLITLCSKCHAKAEFKFLKIKKITIKQVDAVVYNLSVIDDETYIAEGIVTHNCRTTTIYTQKHKEEKNNDNAD